MHDALIEICDIIDAFFRMGYSIHPKTIEILQHIILLTFMSLMLINILWKTMKNQFLIMDANVIHGWGPSTLIYAVIKLMMNDTVHLDIYWNEINSWEEVNHFISYFTGKNDNNDD